MTFALNNMNEAKLLADRLRWLKNERVISLTQAQEICSKLDKIIHFLDCLVEINKGAVSPAQKPSPIVRAAEDAARVVAGWSDSKREYADRITGPVSPASPTKDIK